MKLLLKPLSWGEQKELIESKVERIVQACDPLKIILIGSASRGEMTERSDVDFIILLKDDADLKSVKRHLALSRKGDEWPQDTIVVTAFEFAQKAKVGGVFFIASREGIELYPENHINRIKRNDTA